MPVTSQEMDTVVIAPRGSDLHYSLLFVSDKTRQAILALYGFCHHLQEIVTHSKETDMTRVKLQWWQGELARCYEGEPQHPITKSLAPILQEYAIPRPLLEEFYEGVVLKLESTHVCTEQDQIFYCYRELGIIELLNQYITGFSDRSILQAAHHLGVSLALVKIIHELRKSFLQGKILIPLSDFEGINLEPSDLLSASSVEKVQALLKIQALRAREYYRKGRESLTPAQAYQLHPTLLRCELSLELLNVLEEDKFPVLTQQISLTPLRKFFIVWKNHRRMKRVCR